MFVAKFKRSFPPPVVKFSILLTCLKSAILRFIIEPSVPKISSSVFVPPSMVSPVSAAEKLPA